MFEGEINLTNLQVKPSALDFLRLPVCVRSGFLGRLRIKINWRSIWSTPVEVALEDLYVVAGSKDLTCIDESAEAARALAIKLAALKSLEELRLSAAFQAALAGRSPAPPAEGAKPGMVARMIESIIDNIQIHVRNVHVRFEHSGAEANGAACGTVDGACADVPIALGVVLHSLRVCSTDEAGTERFVAAASPPQKDGRLPSTFKRADLSNFYVYLNTARTGRHATRRASSQDMRAVFEERGGVAAGAGHDFLIKPICGTVRLEINKNAASAASAAAGSAGAVAAAAAMRVSVRMQRIELTVDEVQYHSLLTVLGSISRATVVDRIVYRRYVDRYRGEGDHTDADAARYRGLYRRTLAPSWEPPLDEAEAAELEAMEKEFAFLLLSRWRSMALAVAHAELPERTLSKRAAGAAAASAGMVSRFVGGAVGLAKAAVGRGDDSWVEGPDVVLEREEAEELCEAAAAAAPSSTEDPLPAIPVVAEMQEKSSATTAAAALPSHIALALDLEQAHLSVALLNRSRRPLLTLLVSHTVVGFDQRGPPGGMAVRLRVANVSLQDAVTPNTLYPDVFGRSSGASAAVAATPKSLQSLASPASSNDALIDVVYEAPPLDPSCVADARLQVYMRPSLLVVHSRWVGRLVAFFAAPSTGPMSPEQIARQAAGEAARLAQLQSSSTASLIGALGSRSSLSIRAHLVLPTLVVASHPNILHSGVLVAELGQVDVSTTLQTKEAIKALGETIQLNQAVRQASRDAAAAATPHAASSSSTFSSSTSACSAASSSSSDSRPPIPLLSANEMRQCYDHIHVRLTGMSMFLSQSSAATGGRGFDARPASCTPLLSSPLQMALQVDMSVAPQIEWMAPMRIVGEMGALELEVSTSAFRRIMDIGTSFADMAATSAARPQVHPAGPSVVGTPKAASTPALSIQITSPKPRIVASPATFAGAGAARARSRSRSPSPSPQPHPVFALQRGAKRSITPTPSMSRLSARDSDHEPLSAGVGVGIDTSNGSTAGDAWATSSLPSPSSKEFLTLSDLTDLFQSERAALALLAEVDLDKNGSVSAREYASWLRERKHGQKWRKGMEIEWRVGVVTVRVVDDQRPLSTPTDSPSPNASAAPFSPHLAQPFLLSAQTAGGASPRTSSHHRSASAFHPPRDVVSITIGGILFTQQALTYSSTMSVDVASFVLRDCLTSRGDEFRDIISSAASSSSSSAARRTSTSRSFLSLRMSSTSTEHPDFGCSGADNNGGATAEGDSGAASTAAEPLLPCEIDLGLGNVSVLIDPHAINDVAMFFLRDFLAPSPKKTEAEAQTPAAAPVERASPGPAAVPSPTSVASSPLIPVAIPPAVSMRVRLTLSLFTLHLTRGGRYLSKLATQGLSASMDLRAAHVGGGMDARATIQKLALVDLRGPRPVAALIGLEPISSPAGPAANIARPPVLQVSYSLFSPEAGRSFGYASHVGASLRGVKIVHDFHFFGAMLSWLFATLAMPFIAGDKTTADADAVAPQIKPSASEEKKMDQAAASSNANDAAAASSASAGAADNASSTPPPLPFLKFNVELEDIELVFPNHQTLDPTHRLTFHVRQMDACNHALYGPGPPATPAAAGASAAPGGLVEFQQYCVGIGGVSILSSLFPGAEPSSRASTLVYVDRMCVVTNLAGHLAARSLDVCVETQAVQVALAQESYVFLMEMLWALLDNLTGLWAPKGFGDEEEKKKEEEGQTTAVVPAQPAPVAASTPAPSSSVPSADAAPFSPPAESNWIRVSVLFHSLSVSLQQRKGWTPNDGLITVLGQGMDVRFFMDTTGPAGMGVEAAFAALEVLDDSVKPARATVAVPAGLYTAEGSDDDNDEGEDDEDHGASGASGGMLPEYARMLTMRDASLHPAALALAHPTAFYASQTPLICCDDRLRELSLSSAHPQAPSSPSGALWVSWHQAAVTGAMDVDVRLTHMAYCASSMVVLQLGSFFYIPPKQPTAEQVAQAEAERRQHEEERRLYGRGSISPEGAAAGAGEEEPLLMADALLTGAVAPKLAPPPAGLVLSVRLSLPQALVQLVSSVSRPRARALNVAFDLGLEFFMGEGVMRASVQLDELRALEGARAASDGGYAHCMAQPESEGHAMVLQRCGIHVAFLSAPSALFPGATCMTVDVGIQPRMVLNVGYQHFLCLMGAMTVLFPPADANAQPATMAASEPATPATQGSGDDDASSSAPTSAATSPVALPGALHFCEQNVHVQVEGVQLNLVNDCHQNPIFLARVGVDNLLAKVTRFGDSGGLYARCDVMADTFNPRVLMWEPLLEPWDIIATHHASANTRTPHEYLLLNQPRKRHQVVTGELVSESRDSSVLSSSAADSHSHAYSVSTSRFPNLDQSMSDAQIAQALSPFTSLHLTSSRPFNVTLSVAAVQDLVDYLALVQGAPLKEEPYSVVYKFPPYRIANQTNLDMELFLTSSAAAAHGGHQLAGKRSNTLKMLVSASQQALSAVGLQRDASPISPSEDDAILTPKTKMMLRRLATELIVVPAYSEADITFPEAIRGRQRAIVVRFKAPVTTTTAGDPAAASPALFSEFTLGVSQNQSVKIQLNQRGGVGGASDPMVVVADISVKRGVRLVALHSDCAIGNQSDGTIAVRTTLGTEHIVPRGKLFFLPILPTGVQRQVKVRPYEVETASESGAPLIYLNGSPAPISAVPTATGASTSTGAGAGAGAPNNPTSPFSPRVSGPTSLAESQMLHHWSGDLMCNYALFKERRSDRTRAMHYRCTKRSEKANLVRPSSLAHRSLSYSPQPSGHSPQPSGTHSPQPSGGHSPQPSSDLDASAGSQFDNTIDASAYSFTVFASVWKKQEQRRMAAEDKAAAKDAKHVSSASSSGANDNSSSSSRDADSNETESVSYGELSKKKYCQIYYVRNPLTVENFLASAVSVRMYHTDRQRDDDFKVVDGMMSPPSTTQGQQQQQQNLLAPPEVARATSTTSNVISGAVGGAAATLRKGLMTIALSNSSSSKNPPRLVEEVTLERGQAYPSHAVSTHLDTLVSLRIPGLAAEWTEPVLLRLDDEPTIVKFHLTDSADAGSGSGGGGGSGALTVLGEVSVVQGHVRVILYTHYWLYGMLPSFNERRLGLLIINDETKATLPRLEQPQPQASEDRPLPSGSTSPCSRAGTKSHSKQPEEAWLAENPIEQSNAQLGLRDNSAMEASTSASAVARTAAAAAAQAAQAAEDRDRVQPVMFSSKHQLSKKQRVRLQIGWVPITGADGAHSATSSATSTPVAQPRTLTAAPASRVGVNMLGPTDDPSGHDAPLLASSSNFLVSWSEASDSFSMEHVGTTESISILSLAAPAGALMTRGAGAASASALIEGTCFELVCSVTNGPGRFYRTKQVTFAPRYVLVNKLNVPLLVRQYAPAPKAGVTPCNSVVTLGALETQTFHWPHPVREGRPWLSFKRAGGGMEGWHWTGFLDLNIAGDTPMLVTHSRTHQSWFAHLEVRLGPLGTAFVVIDELKQQGLVEELAMALPFLVQNRSATQTVRFRQVRDRPELSSRYMPHAGIAALGRPSHNGKLLLPTSSTTAMGSSSSSSSSSSSGGVMMDVSAFDYFEVPPRGIFPWVWEEHLQEHRLQVQFSVLNTATRKVVDWQKDKRIEFDADEEGDTTLRMRVDGSNSPTSGTPNAAATAAAPTQKIYWWVESTGPAQVLVFADKPKSKKKNLLTTVTSSVTNSVSTTMSTVLGVVGVDGRRGATAAPGLEEIKEGEEEWDMKEIPDDSAPAGSNGHKFGATTAAGAHGALGSSSHVDPRLAIAESREPDGGLAVFDPANENEADRRVERELLGGNLLQLPPVQASVSPNSSGVGAPAHSASSSLRPAAPVPADFTGAGVLHLTVIGARGFKPSRRNLFAGVVFNGMRQRTDVVRDQAEPKWGRRMTFASDIDTDDFSVRTCGCFSGTTIGSSDKKKQKNKKGGPGGDVSGSDRQLVFVNLYEKTTWSDHFLGAATIRLRDIGFEHTDAWFDVVKQKGGRRGMEVRGQVHLSLWWQQDAAAMAGQNLIEEEAMAQQSPAGFGAGSDAASSLRMLTPGIGDEPGAPSASPSLGPEASVSASVSAGPRLHRMAPTTEHLIRQRELFLLTQPAAYQECDQSNDRLWSEYRIRFLTTALLKELAAAHGLDFLQGRLVAYVTCPLMARGYSVLLMDHGVHNMSKKWRQDIRFALPHYQAKRFRQYAIVRITLFFFRSQQAASGGALLPAAEPPTLMQAQEEQQQQPMSSLAPEPSSAGVIISPSPSPSPNASSSPAPAGPSFFRGPISGRACDLYTEPVRVAECHFDLMNVREVPSMGSQDGDEADESNDGGGSGGGGGGGNNEKKALEEQRAAEEADRQAVLLAEAEEELAAHPDSAAAKAKAADARKRAQKKKTKKELQAEERDRQRREWQAKWIPLVSSVKFVPAPAPTSPSAEPSVSASNSVQPSAFTSSVVLPAQLRLPSLCLNVKRTVVERDRGKSYRPNTTMARVSLPLLGVSFVDSSPEEVAYLSVTGIGCTLTDSQWQSTVAATIASFQVDNHLARCAFPVVCNMSLLQGADVLHRQPFVQVALNKKKTTLPNLSLYPYFSLLVQKMDVRVEEASIWRTLNFVNQMAMRFGGDLTQDLHPDGLTRRWSHAMAVPVSGTSKLFFKLLHIQPLALNVSFAAQPGQRQSIASYQINPLYTFLAVLQSGLGSINDAPLRLNGKLIENALGTSDTIVWSLVSHYIQQGVMEAYKIVGSIEAIGNPVALAHDIGTGSLDFFSEPARGLMISPEAFGTGLAKGSSSLLKGTLGGVMSAASSVTNSASKAMATASGDETFVASQAAARSAHQPEHLADGLKMGVTALGSSLFSGVTGVFLDPLAGAKKEGLLGFGKGLAKGIAGVVFKPLSGVLDLTTNTLKGIGNTASYFLDGPLEELKAVRPKRYIERSGVIQPYDLAMAAAHDRRWHQSKDDKDKHKKDKASKPMA